VIGKSDRKFATPRILVRTLDPLAGRALAVGLHSQERVGAARPLDHQAHDLGALGELGRAGLRLRLAAFDARGGVPSEALSTSVGGEEPDAPFVHEPSARVAQARERPHLAAGAAVGHLEGSRIPDEAIPILLSRESVLDAVVRNREIGAAGDLPPGDELDHIHGKGALRRRFGVNGNPDEHERDGDGNERTR